MNKRDRSGGWTFAKKDGHNNERKFASDLGVEPSLLEAVFDHEFGPQWKKYGVEVTSEEQKRVSSIFADKTTSKNDLEFFSSGKHFGASLKKSPSGQVWLVTTSNFLRALDFYGGSISSDFEIGLKLFIGGADNLADVQKLYEAGINQGSAHTQTEIRKERLTLETINRISRNIYEEFLEGIRANMSLITTLAFSRGTAINEEDWSTWLIYNKPTVSSFRIEDVMGASNRSLEMVSPGPKNGGTTVWLPWGFLQMHRPQGKNLLQFHHKYNAIVKITEPVEHL